MMMMMMIGFGSETVTRCDLFSDKITCSPLGHHCRLTDTTHHTAWRRDTYTTCRISLRDIWTSVSLIGPCRPLSRTTSPTHHYGRIPRHRHTREEIARVGRVGEDPASISVLWNAAFSLHDEMADVLFCSLLCYTAGKSWHRCSQSTGGWMPAELFSRPIHVCMQWSQLFACLTMAFTCRPRGLASPRHRWLIYSSQVVRSSRGKSRPHASYRQYITLSCWIPPAARSILQCSAARHAGKLEQIAVLSTCRLVDPHPSKRDPSFDLLTSVSLHV